MPSFINRLLTILGLGFWSFYAYGQHPYELKLTSENDNYCLQYHDGYYTNGLFLAFNYLPKRWNSRLSGTSKTVKVTSYYQLGQMIFTPESVTPKVTRDRMDRPYAGYLFAEKGFTFFYKKGHVLKTSLAVGTIGENALARPAQELIHNTFNLVPATGWQYQIKNELQANVQGQYWFEVIPQTWRRSWFDLHTVSQVTVGNTFTNASVGLLVQIGLFSRPAQSAMYNARISRGEEPGSKATELYMFFQPIYQYQLYNATVEGGMFTDDRGAILSSLRHEGYQYHAGFTFAQPRWTFQLVYSYKQREAATMRHDEQYAGLTLAYRFGR